MLLPLKGLKICTVIDFALICVVRTVVSCGQVGVHDRAQVGEKSHLGGR